LKPAVLDATESESPSLGTRLRLPRLTAPSVIGLTLLSVQLFVALLGGWLAPQPPGAIVSSQSFATPGQVPPLGTDYLGRDLFSRLLHGAGYTLGLAAATTVLGFALGVFVGFAAAEAGGWVDVVISRGVDVLICFPPLLLALVVIATLGPSIMVLVVTVALIHATRVARVSRSMAMSILALDFVEVARARGEGFWWLITREIWPNTLGPLAAEFGLRMTQSVLFLSALSFLGLGIQPPLADWGLMVRENLSGLYYGILPALLPALAIVSLTIGVNLVVDWLTSGTGREISGDLLR
jgi:peptide/nickel transport system permease protein